ncbi:cupin domain-containing protein [Oceanicoccus sagamiensis]|uniref:(S)-ureidoglycine aminohydrolase cupin domain-containing protein n=1 Tax=Oceanicoccus sagamiensis TaxID=716816 RepID=A0A1X9NPA6_9GAMM|nr:cupin domain-containing protein [Oceanicoccus sagamiensis]ARN75723.1 hypothetical protein BST96_17385 [Oceanicoccus sagamiensis]
MPTISVQKAPLQLSNLEPCESFGEPIGDLPLQSDACFYDQDGVFMGTWECEPGKLQLNLAVTEFCHLIKGHWKLTDENGNVTELKAGDSFCFPKGWVGVSEVVETVRKVYTMLE